MAAHEIVFSSALAFLFGITAAGLNWHIIIVIVIIAAVGLISLFLLNKLQLWKYVSLFLVFIFLGAFYYNFYLNLQERSQNIKFNSQITFSGKISDEPILSEKYLSFTLILASPFSGKIRVLTNPTIWLNYGDIVRADGRILPADSRAGKPVAFFPKIQIIANGQGFWLKEKLLALKNHLTSQFEKVLSSDEAALLGGITFGSRSSFGSEFKKQMALSGTTHLVALSGYNISILVLAVSQAFGWFLSRRKTFYLTVLVIVLFVLMVGAEASVVRAAIMGFLALLAKEIGRIYNMRNAITLTATAMVLVSPTILVHSPGFQLSFVSLLGIVYLSPALAKLLRIDGEKLSGYKEIVLTTVSAQLAVLPLVIITFGRFSLSAFLANILILGFVPLTMFLGFLLAAISSLYSYLGFFTARLVELLLVYEIVIIKFFAKLVLPIPFGASWAAAITYYAILALIIYRYSRTSTS